MSKPDNAPLGEKLSQSLLLLCLVVLGIGQSFIFASLPPIGREIGLADVRISTLITIGAAAFVVAAFMWGGLINRFGRVRSVIIGMASYALTIALTGFVLAKALDHQLSADHAYYWVFVLRVIFAFGIAGVLPSIQAYLVAHSDVQKRSGTIAKIGASFSIGMILGPACASLLSRFGLTAPFYIIGLVAALACLLVILCVQDHQDVRQRNKAAAINWFRQPVMPFLFMSVLAILSVTGVQQIMGFLIQDRFHLDVSQTTQQLGFAMMTMSCLSIFVQMILVPRFQFGVVVLITTGFCLGLLSQLVFVFLTSYWSVLLAMGLFGAGFGFLFPGILTAQTLLVKDDQQSRLASINASMQGLGAALGPVTLASLYQVGNQVPFVFLGLGLMLIMAIFQLCRKRLIGSAS